MPCQEVMWPVRRLHALSVGLALPMHSAGRPGTTHPTSRPHSTPVRHMFYQKATHHSNRLHILHFASKVQLFKVEYMYMYLTPTVVKHCIVVM